MNPASPRGLWLFVFKHYPGGKPHTPTDQVGGHAFPENALGGAVTADYNVPHDGW